MALAQCPHMTAVCPHKRDDCDDDASKDCIYISQTAAAALTSLSALRMTGLSQTPGQHEHVESLERLLMSIQVNREQRR
jgi:hypothetical protein